MWFDHFRYLIPHKAVFLEQLYRAIVGDRHYYSHDTLNEDAALSTLGGLILNNSLVSSMALDAFTAPGSVASPTCPSTEVTEVYLADECVVDVQCTICTF